MNTPGDLSEIRLDDKSLFREELFTDRRLGSIRKLVPIKTDGSDDGERKVVFEGQTSLLTPAGTLPLAFEIDASTLAEAVERFPDAAQRALKHTLEELEAIRRQAASSLIVPGHAGGGGIADLGKPGGRSIKLP